MRTFILLLTLLGVTQLPLRAQLPIITNQPASKTVWTGGNLTFAVGVSNAGPFNYQWQLNSNNLPNGIITTVAGNGNIATYTNGQYVYGFGDGGPATNANVYVPYGVAVDAVGNLFIADWANNRVRKVDSKGIITTVAGTNSSGFSGDGGLATNARLRQPSGVAVDASGNLFIADAGNNRIRKVGTDGIITTFAGTNSAGFSGDGGAATNAKLSRPFGVAVDSYGNLFIADLLNYRIRKVDTNGIITT